MSFCLFHDTLASICHGPHCPSCGATDYHGTECIGFERHKAVTP